MQSIIDCWVSCILDLDTLLAFSIIGIDEIALKKEHHSFVMIVTARRSEGELLLLTILPNRTKESVSS